ncbi:MAG: family 78 glycoside hydrolase catalytic domain [Clostridia bacterium]|nr:family 78 glycoside hydrolase catalytic domain [Clostridia bacterium]
MASKDNFRYSTEYRSFAGARYITASESAMEEPATGIPKEESFPCAKYIWPVGHRRFHASRVFVVSKKVERAEMAFLCDNLLDIWLNGKRVACDAKHLPLTDITDLLCDGDNNLHIRGYQSDSYKRISAAITGGVRIYYQDGGIEEILTDEQFREIHFVTFWETEEPDGFELAVPYTKYRTTPLNVMERHPAKSRRSFYFKKTFNVEKLPVKAMLFSSALGCYEPYLNGERVTDGFFMPFSQVYHSEYQQFDILPQLKIGENTIGMITGNGWYNCHSWGQLEAKVPAVIATLELEYKNGEKEFVHTGKDWIAAPSPLIENDLQYGERYDARLEIDNWCSANADGFKPVDILREESPTLLLQSYPSVKKAKEYKPQLLRILPDGSPLYDVGSCIAGRMRITFRDLPAGKDVKIRYCERLAEDGISPEIGAYTTVFYQNDCAPDGRSPYFMRNLDVYTAKGAELETYECRFSYTGYRYLWIEGLDSLEQLVKLVPFELRTDLVETGSISTPHAAINKIFDAARRSWFNNICNGPTDCPTREKNFWNGDAAVFSHAACWLTDNSAFLSRWTDNGIKMHSGPYAWEDETYEIPLTLYKFYGDTEILRKRFPEMLALIDKRTEYEGMILPENEETHEYCDWLSPTGVSPSKRFFKGCWYYHMLDSVAKVADIIGETEKHKALRERADKAKALFNQLHLLENENDYDARSQCGLVLPLAFGICPEETCARLAHTLNEYVKREDYHLTTGFIGTRYLFDVLADYGYLETVYRLITQTTFPSWLDMLSGGATSISESWLGLRDPDKSLSMSHFSLGSVICWFFEYLGGIRIKDSEPGLSRITLKPHPMKEIGSFAVKYISQHGAIYTEWHYEGDKPVFAYRLPDGVEADVFF